MQLHYLTNKSIRGEHSLDVMPNNGLDPKINITHKIINHTVILVLPVVGIELNWIYFALKRREYKYCTLKHKHST